MSQTLQSSTSLQRGNISVWAFIFIAAGVMWLLREANILSGQHLAILFRLWPLLLIAIGVQLLLGRRNRQLSQLVVGATIAILVGLMIVGPSIGLAGDSEVKTATLSEPLGVTESAQVNLSLATGQGSVYALSNSDELIAADLQYVGSFQFDVQDGAQAVVTLKHEDDERVALPLFGFLDGENNDLHWNVGLSPSVPMDLSVSGGVGTSTIDLSGLQLTSFSLSTGVGEDYVTLPDTLSEPLSIDISGGVGRTILTIPEGIIVRGEISGGIGETQIDLDEDAAVRISARSGVGGLSFPDSWVMVSGRDNDGVWESPAYSDAAEDERIEIGYDGGVGALRVY